MDGLPNELFSDFNEVKKRNAGLKTVIALGGWTFNDPGKLLLSRGLETSLSHGRLGAIKPSIPE